MRRAHIVLFSVSALLALPIAAAAKQKVSVESNAFEATVTGVSDAGATLKAKIVPSVAGTLVAFDYGTTTGYGRRVAASPAVLPLSGATATAPITGLQPDTTYHFRVVLTAAGVDLPGLDETFKTQPAPPVPQDGGDRQE